jgi:hypothetical protein
MWLSLLQGHPVYVATSLVNQQRPTSCNYSVYQLTSLR